MVLATGMAFVMLWFGGGGGLVNMSYGMNAMIHNTSWVTAHCHLIFAGTAVIMYFAIAYSIWPVLTGRAPLSLRSQRIQLWMWFVGMMVLTLPWHLLGLLGQPRRVATFNYADPIIAAWEPWVIISLVGGRHPAGERPAVHLEPARIPSRRRCPRRRAEAAFWNPDLLRNLSRPTAAGNAAADVCAGCHGERGISPDAQYPNLAGQSAVAIYKQLHDSRAAAVRTRS